MRETKNLCNHAGCRCEIEPGEKYCGDYCREEPFTGMEQKPMSCRCGHEPCSSPEDPALHT